MSLSNANAWKINMAFKAHSASFQVPLSYLEPQCLKNIEENENVLKELRLISRTVKIKFERHVPNIEVESFESLSTSSDDSYDSCSDGTENEFAERTVLAYQG